MASWDINVPSFEVPDYLNTPTGRIERDLVPLITMFACAPTLFVFYRKGRYVDLAAYSFGFIVAVVYHMLHMAAHDGLNKVHFLGIHGAAWRTVDIMGANVLLARTMGHALNVDHPLIALLPNVALPGILVTLLFTLGDGVMGVQLVTRVTMIIVGITMVLQLGQGGLDLLHNMGAKYNHPRMMRAVTSIAVGIFCFTMPNRQPQNYWIWHSVWHVLMGLGFWDLYLHLLQNEDQAAKAKANRAKAEQTSPEPTLMTRLFSAEEVKVAVGEAKAAVGALVQDAEPTVRGRGRRRSSGRAETPRSASKGPDMPVPGVSPSPAGRAKSAGKGRGKAQGRAPALSKEDDVQAVTAMSVVEEFGLRPRTRRQAA